MFARFSVANILKCDEPAIRKKRQTKDLLTTMPKMIEFTLKWRHECYQLPTTKYPMRYYSFKKLSDFGNCLRPLQNSVNVSVRNANQRKIKSLLWQQYKIQYKIICWARFTRRALGVSKVKRITVPAVSITKFSPLIFRLERLWGWFLPWVGALWGKVLRLMLL
jgi:hypothetical protein